MVILYMVWDPSPALFDFNLPLLGRPILWYGLFFALGFFLAYQIFIYSLKEFLSPLAIEKQKISQFADRLLLFAFAGILIGARLIDVLFYQGVLHLWRDPGVLLRFWEGGLASHGGIAGLCAAFLLLSYRGNVHPSLNFWRFLDLAAIPACIAGGLIRIGNFFNQEILGKPTDLPWAILFGHPADGGLPLPRHPVQLYESFFYLSLGLIMMKLRSRLTREGQIAGLILIAVFSFRFLIEFWKEPLSLILGTSSVFQMGQWLSLPFLGLGILLLIGRKKLLHAFFIKGQ